ncbi:hypothetical protein ACO03V_14475 [Microbacterium sp. HMH0099]|uniref:hypothetical protein n=1 Tax=Microbacterium sp. HMH0099 TaxID=3414026 RepID=UPI003BF695F3
MAAIHSTETQQALTNAGYPDVTLRVSDRRLEIRSTSLAELGAGLATFLADHLAAITAELQKERASAQLRLAAAVEAENSRAETIAREAQRISFTPTPAAS